MRRPDTAVDSSPAAATDAAGAAPPGVARDALFSGQVTLFQPHRGYKVTVDTLLLADFAARVLPDIRHLVDLGAGVGALTLAVAHLGRVGRASLVEREAPLAELAERNLAAAQLSGSVHAADLDQGLPRELVGAATAVISNPPFYTGRRDATSLRGRARGGDLAPFLRAAARAMGRRGRAFFVYPAPALTELLTASRGAELVPKRLRLVHAFVNAPARVALVELRRAKPGGLVVEAPLIEWSSPGVRSAEVLRVVSGGRPAAGGVTEPADDPG